jgi:TonB family protein
MRTSLAFILASSMFVPAAVHAGATDSAASTPAIRITTGVTAPSVINSGDFTVTSDALSGVGAEKPSVVLALRVNEKGMAENVRVVHSVNYRVDAQVLAAARDFRFRPATLDQQPVPVDLRLTVVVQR